jgi:hypothetical protein
MAGDWTIMPLPKDAEYYTFCVLARVLVCLPTDDAGVCFSSNQYYAFLLQYPTGYVGIHDH